MKLTNGLFIATLIAAFQLSAGVNKLSQDLRSVRHGNSVDVIVQFNAEATAGLDTRMLRRGAKLRRQLSLVRAAVYSIPAAALEDLSNDPEVAYVSPDRAVKGMLDYAEPTINASIAFQNGYDGTGIGVAVIDSGIAKQRRSEEFEGSAPRRL